MSIATVPALREIEWHIDGRLVSRTQSAKLTWPLVPGQHEVYAQVRTGDSYEVHATEKVRFCVR